MILSHFWGLITHPDEEWSAIREHPPGIVKLYLTQVIWACSASGSLYLLRHHPGWLEPARQRANRSPDRTQRHDYGREYLAGDSGRHCHYGWFHPMDE